MQVYGFSILDICVVLIMSLSTMIATYRGLTKSLISFVGWVLALVLALRAADIVAPVFYNYAVNNKVLAEIFGAVTLFLGLAFFISFLNNFLYALTTSLSGGMIDRSLGMLFGLIRGCIVLSILGYMVILTIPALQEKGYIQTPSTNEEPHIFYARFLNNSRSVDLVLKGAELTSYYMPKNFTQSVRVSVDKLSVSIIEDSKPDYTQRMKPVNVILSRLPLEVLDSIPKEDLSNLQDAVTPHENKVKILENISYEYQKYHNKSSDPVASEERELLNSQFEDIMTSIEKYIVFYNKQ